MKGCILFIPICILMVAVFGFGGELGFFGGIFAIILVAFLLAKK